MSEFTSAAAFFAASTNSAASTPATSTATEPVSASDSAADSSAHSASAEPAPTTPAPVNPASATPSAKSTPDSPFARRRRAVTQRKEGGGVLRNLMHPSVRKACFVLCVVLCATPYLSAPIALLGGFLFTLLLGHPFPKLSGKATGLLLKASVVGLGFGMNIHSALQVGREGLWLTVASISTVLILGFVFGRWLHMRRKMSHLVASGTAICGGSAIAAVAPAVNANEKETSVSLGVVFLLNSVALIVFPVIGHLLGLTQHQFGMWSAIAIHDTSSVVGASSAYGAEALNVATTVKLARALWIIPVSLLSALLFKSAGKKISIPWFIGLFILAMLANSYLPLVGLFNTAVVSVSKAALVVTLFLIGSSLSVEKIRSVGFKPLLLGVLLWVVVSVGSLLAILHVG